MRHAASLFVSVVLFLTSSAVAAQSQPYLVRDLGGGGNTTIDGTWSSSSNLLITADDGVHGNEPWCTDGSPTGGVLLDIEPNGSSYAGNAFPAGAGFMFTAQTTATGREVWWTDCTPSGTRLLRDIVPGTGGVSLNDVVEFNGNWYFSVRVGGFSRLWKTDGTVAGTSEVIDMNIGTELAVFQGALYFVGRDTTSGAELWRSDGTAAGTALAVDFSPGSTSGQWRYLTPVGDKLFFVSFDPSTTSNEELWATDGTAAGTYQVKDISPGASQPTALMELNGVLLFQANDGTGLEMWRSDGTSAGTRMVADVNPGGSSNPFVVTTGGGHAYFKAWGPTTGYEVWRTDGSTAELFFEEVAGAGNATAWEYTWAGGNLFMVLPPSSYGYGSRLFVTQGTASGLTLLLDNAAAGKFAVLNDTPYFLAGFGSPASRQLATSDGTVEGTKIVEVIAAEPGSSSPKNFRDFNGRVLLEANAQWSRLFESQATRATTFPFVADGQMLLWQLGGEQFLYDATNLKLRATDGQTVRDVSDVRVYSTEFAVVGSEAYFLGWDPTNFKELWKSDGTTVGTVAVTTTFPSNVSLYLTEGGATKAYFVIRGSTGYEWWTTDGTTAGTFKIATVGSPIAMKVIGDRAFLQAGNSLMTSLGTAPNDNVSLGGIDGGLGVHNGLLYFAGMGPSGVELYTSDGTPAGTQLLADINSVGDSSPGEFVSSGGTLYFAADDGATGRELWKSDGTAAGTTRVADIAVGLTSSNPTLLTATPGGRIFFVADDGLSGPVIRKSNGTSAGTTGVPQAEYGTPQELFSFGNYLLFAAGELWALDVRECTSGLCCNGGILVGAGAECRPKVGTCDVAETCDGQSPDCPMDGFETNPIECRDAFWPCDVAEYCDGSGPNCPTDVYEAAGVLCRDSMDVCDVPEYCNGTSIVCPQDQFLQASLECRPSAGECDVPDFCDGAQAGCPVDAREPTTTVCRASTGMCDLPESCTGTGIDCPQNVFVPSSFQCRPSGGDCDVPEFCSGTDGACPTDAVVAAGTECRGSRGVCDSAEACDGAAATCPTDVGQPDGTACGDGQACNGAETCQASVCQPAPVLDCDDGDVCTTDMCGEPDGCLNEPIVGCCHDNSDCLGGPACAAGICDPATNRCEYVTGVELTCDGVDNDCDPLTADFEDFDQDGFDNCGDADAANPDGLPVDCVDTDSSVRPDAEEVVCDGRDNDCDAATLDVADEDGDGFDTCPADSPLDTDGVEADCDDANEFANPGEEEELCDGFDNDCDPDTFEVPDGDGDGICEDMDNCPGVSNPDQADTDGDGVGDACDDVQTMPDMGTADMGGDEPDMGSSEPDLGDEVDTGVDTGSGPTTITHDDPEGCCSTVNGGGGQTPWWLAGALGLLLVGRRRD